VPSLASGATGLTIEVRATDTGGNGVLSERIALENVPDITPPEIIRTNPDGIALVGLLRTHFNSTLFFRAWSIARAVGFSSMLKRDHILVVCTANICRSPMGERLLAHALAAEASPLKELAVVSAGLSAYHGDPASQNSVTTLKSVGIRLDDHQSQRLSQELLDKSFAVFCMTQTHRAQIEAHFRPQPPYLYLFRELMGEGASVEIPDPFGRSVTEYELCRDAMVEAIPSLLAFLREHYTHYCGQGES